MFMIASRMKSSGTISIDNTVGAQGKVYMHIPEKGSGRVLVTVNNSLREYDATSNDGKPLATGTPVRVVWVDGNQLVVESI
jgi:membrane-bound ClpP family serine protease